MPDEEAVAGLMSLRREVDATLPDAGRYEWRLSKQLHMTLRFLGRFPGDVAPALHESLAALAADAARIALEFDRVECWPGPGVLVARSKASAPLAKLLADIDAAASAAGYTEHAGTQNPHVTLAYVDRSHRPIARAYPLASSLEAVLGHVSLVTTVTGGYKPDAWWPLQDPPLAAGPDALQ
jgi:2'-5' RNA ligase